MKVNNLFQLRIVRLGTFIGVTALILTSGCEKASQDESDWGGTQNISIVKTEWNSESSDEKSGKETNESPYAEEYVEEPFADEFVESVSEEQTFIEDDPLLEEPYSVQVGAFLNKKYADEMVKKLRQKGYEPVLVKTKISVKEWNLVRVGNYTDKNVAIEAAEKITQQEQIETAVVKNDSIVKLAKKQGLTPVKRVQPESSMKGIKAQEVSVNTTGNYSFQVGGLRTKENAENFKQLLAENGYVPFIVEVPSAYGTESWYTVRIGRYADIDVAAAAADDFMSKENIPAQAISLE